MADQPRQDGFVSPSWGWFPAEQFLIRRWDPASPRSPDEQRRALIESFMKTEELPDGGVTRVPTADEVRDILAPWRPPKLRKIAHRYLREGRACVILRTHYGSGSDAEMAAVLEDELNSDESASLDDSWWRVLDDAELFSLEDWKQVFQVLPELVGHQGQQLRRGLTDTEVAGIYEEFAEYTEETLDPVSPIVDQIQKSAAAGNGPLFVADKQALEEKLLEVFFLDGFGHVVRHSAIEPESIGDMKSREDVTRDVSCWSDGYIGHLYKNGGEMGRKYYRQSE